MATKKNADTAPEMEEMVTEETVTQEAADKKNAKKAEKKDKEAKQKIEALEQDLEKARADKKEIEDRYLRVLAEYDNFKKRSSKEKDEAYFHAKSDMIKKLLPVFDNFDRAQKYSSAEDYTQGVDMIIRQFFDILEGMDVKEIAKEGDEFDPTFHEAVFREDKEGVPENTITEVLQKGYAVGDKVIRYAMVKVSG